MNSSRTVSIQEFCHLAGISKSLGYKLAAEGEIAGIPVIKLGDRLLLSKEKAEAVLAGEQPGREL